MLGVGGEGTNHPASRERAAERMHGVSIQGFWRGSVVDPILDVRLWCV
jgi:hypothetical protein